jgi:hypothetical protein
MSSLRLRNNTQLGASWLGVLALQPIPKTALQLAAEGTKSDRSVSRNDEYQALMKFRKHRFICR